VLQDAVLEQQQASGKAAAAAAAGLEQHLHYAELRAPGGVVMPWTLHRLLRCVQDSQAAHGFTAFLGTEPSSSSLNALPEQWAAADAAADAVAAAAAAGVAGAPHFAGRRSSSGRQQPQAQHWQREGRGFAADEVQAWASSALLLQGRVLRQLRVDASAQAGGCMAARLA
jgi:hypothetical protein